jgi:hypothetical protein
MDSIRRLAPAAYCTGVVLILLPTVDYLNNASPFRPTAADWRFDVLGMISTHLLYPLLGFLLVSATAAAFPHPRVSRILGLLIWVGAIVLLMAAGGFVLDSLQVRNAAPAGARWVSQTGFVIAAAKILAGAVTLMVLGVGNRRAAGAYVAPPSTRSAPAAIIGQR